MVSKVILRDRIARIVASTRFPFIDQEDWDENRITLVNTSRERHFGLKGSDDIFFPNIVVLNPDGGIREIGEIEMDVSPDLIIKWKLFSESTSLGDRVKKFFLYVPDGMENSALKLLEENNIEYAGLRTWILRDGVLTTHPVITPDMPKDHRKS